MDSRAMPLCAWLQYGHRPEPPCFQVVASSRCLTDKPVGSRLCRGSFAVAMPHALVQGFDPDEFFFTPRLRYCLYIALAHSRNYGLPALPRAFFCLRIRNSRLTEGFLEQHKNRPPFRDAGFAVQHQFNSQPGSESPPPVVALWSARAVPASLARRTPAPSVNTPAIRRSRPRRCGTCSATLAIPVWCHR